jgi:hypothetical protein
MGTNKQSDGAKNDFIQWDGYSNLYDVEKFVGKMLGVKQFGKTKRKDKLYSIILVDKEEVVMVNPGDYIVKNKEGADKNFSVYDDRSFNEDKVKKNDSMFIPFEE